MKKRISGTNSHNFQCDSISQYIHDQQLLNTLMEWCGNSNYTLEVVPSGADNITFLVKKISPQKNKFITSLLDQYVRDFLNMFEIEISATSTNYTSIDTYNAFAKYDEWPGGYVQGYGNVENESSNSYLYGQPLILGTSWVYKGVSQAPVAEGKFYELVLNSLWHGGFVDNYGYMGDLQQVLGSTGAEQLVQVYPGYGTIGSIVNASLMLDHAVTQSQVYEDMNGTTISDDGLQQLLQNYFPASSPAIYDDIEEALDDQCVIIVRVNMNSITSNIPNHVISGDYNVVDYNPVRNRYVCFDSVSKQIKVLDKNLIDSGVISARFYVITR